MGYHQMLTVIEIVKADPEALTLETKRLYPAVAKRHHANRKQAERNLRMVLYSASCLIRFSQQILIKIYNIDTA